MMFHGPVSQCPDHRLRPRQVPPEPRLPAGARRRDERRGRGMQLPQQRPRPRRQHPRCHAYGCGLAPGMKLSISRPSAANPLPAIRGAPAKPASSRCRSKRQHRRAPWPGFTVDHTVAQPGVRRLRAAAPHLQRELATTITRFSHHANPANPEASPPLINAPLPHTGSGATGCVVWGAGGWQLDVPGAGEGQRGRRTGRIPVTRMRTPPRLDFTRQSRLGLPHKVDGR